MTENVQAPNFEKVRKEFCQELAYQLRNPKLTNDNRLAILEKLSSMLHEELHQN